MFEPPHQPAPAATPPIATAPGVAPPAGFPPAVPERRRPRWLLPAIIGAVALLVGAGGATAALLLFDRVGQPRHRYEVSVFLDHDATAAQKETVRTALLDVDPVDEIRFESREQAWENFRELYKDRPEMIDNVEAKNLPESYRLATEGTQFECGPMARIRGMSGVADIVIVQRPTGDRPGAKIACP